MAAAESLLHLKQVAHGLCQHGKLSPDERKHLAEFQQRATLTRTCKGFQVVWKHLLDIHTHVFDKCSTEKAMALSVQHGPGSNLTYGEVPFSTVADIILGVCGDAPSGIFYDLGAGSGRISIAAALLGAFRKVYGIELLGSLHKASIEVLARYKASGHDDVKSQGTDVHFAKGNILSCDWSDADMVFVNSTCFDTALITSMANQGRRLRLGTYFVTITHKLNSPFFDLLSTHKYDVSWGQATFYVHRRNSHGIDKETSKTANIPVHLIATDSPVALGAEKQPATHVRRHSR